MYAKRADILKEGFEMSKRAAQGDISIIPTLIPTSSTGDNINLPDRSNGNSSVASEPEQFEREKTSTPDLSQDVFGLADAQKPVVPSSREKRSRESSIMTSSDDEDSIRNHFAGGMSDYFASTTDEDESDAFTESEDESESQNMSENQSTNQSSTSSRTSTNHTNPPPQSRRLSNQQLKQSGSIAESLARSIQDKVFFSLNDSTSNPLDFQNTFKMPPQSVILSQLTEDPRNPLIFISQSSNTFSYPQFWYSFIQDAPPEGT